LRLFSFGGYGLALAALALVVFGAIECPPPAEICRHSILYFEVTVRGLGKKNRDYLAELGGG